MIEVDDRIFNLCILLSENLKREWTLEDMAKICELSVPHFKKLFKSETMTPPIAWFHERRLAAFAELLVTTHDPIKRLAFQTGLSSGSHLSQDFKKRYGLTPTAYRKRHHQIEQSKSRNCYKSYFRVESDTFSYQKDT